MYRSLRPLLVLWFAACDQGSVAKDGDVRGADTASPADSGDSATDEGGATWGLAPVGVAGGGVTCGEETCDVGAVCCFGVNSPACVPSGDADQCTWATAACDDAGDCGGGAVCCGTKTAGAFYGDTTCLAAAECETLVGAAACAVDADCGEGGYCARAFTNGAVLALGLCQSLPPTDCAARPGADCGGDDLHEVDLYGVDLAGVTLAGADLSGAELHSANLAGADLGLATLDGASLSGAWMEDVEAAGASFVGTSMQLGSGDRMVLTDARLDGAMLWGSFRDADLGRASLVGAALLGNTTSRLDLSGARLVGADLTDALFSHVTIEGGSLEGAILDGTSFFDVVCPDGALADESGGTCEDHRAP